MFFRLHTLTDTHTRTHWQTEQGIGSVKLVKTKREQMTKSKYKYKQHRCLLQTSGNNKQTSSKKKMVEFLWGYNNNLSTRFGHQEEDAWQGG